MRSLLGCAKEYPALTPRQGPARNSLRSLRSLRSNSLAELDGWRACGARPCLGARAGGAKGADPKQPDLKRRCAVSERIAGFGCWGLPLCAAGFAAKAGVPAKRASLTSPGRLFDRSERSERREFLPDPCLGRKHGNPLPEARGERSAGRASLLTFLHEQESESAAGPKPRRAAPNSHQNQNQNQSQHPDLTPTPRANATVTTHNPRLASPHA